MHKNKLYKFIKRPILINLQKFLIHVKILLYGIQQHFSSDQLTIYQHHIIPHICGVAVHLNCNNHIQVTL